MTTQTKQDPILYGHDFIPPLPPTPKQESIQQLNDLQVRAQQIFFDLEAFNEHDIANASLTKTIELIDEIGKIRNRVLKGDKETDKITTETKEAV
jgi:hypothetical protein